VARSSGGLKVGELVEWGKALYDIALVPEESDFAYHGWKPGLVDGGDGTGTSPTLDGT